MKTILKNKKLFVGLIMSALLLPACNDWTDPESLTLHTPSFEEQNPELYEAYLKDLCNYKAGDHNVMFVSFNNPLTHPVNRSEHLTVLPDSIDFVSLNNPDQLSGDIQNEMVEIRRKGTRIVYTIDYAGFEKDWTAIVKNSDGSLTEEDALQYLGERTDEMLALCDRYNYDGVIVDYTGRSMVSLPEKELAEYNARQKNFLDRIGVWIDSHKGKTLAFYGNAQYLFPEYMSILSKCDYIILKTLSSTGEGDLSVKAYMAVQAGKDAAAELGGSENLVPTDRFVACVETPRPEDKEQAFGYWDTETGGSKMLATYGAAKWVASPSVDFERKGLFVQNAHNDYFDNNPVYRNIRESIQIMNPNN